MRKLLIVDDHKLIFDGLEKKFDFQFELDYAQSSTKTLNKLETDSYYAVIIDVSLGEEKGFDLFKAIPKSTYTVFLSMHKISVYIRMAQSLGAHGYFLKDEPLDLLLEALNQPLKRKFWMSPAVEKELQNGNSYPESKYDQLSPREQQIFSLLVGDLNYKNIAGRLKISTKTVNNHRDHLMQKLEIKTQTGLVREAIRLGIISVE